MTWKVGLILRMVCIVFHSLATVYVLQMVTEEESCFESPVAEIETSVVNAMEQMDH